jgi:regulator of sirC expression with transglutaminase-like and TPR domain
MLTGRRLGIHLYGLNLPGHFMVISMEPDNIRVFDCFNKGRPLPKQTSWYLEQSLRLTSSSIIKLKAKTPEIILRVLRNLMNASFRKADKEKHRFYSDLFDQLIRRMEDNPGT